jgi:uncharacterized membrane protein
MTLLRDYWFAVLALLLGGGMFARALTLRNAGRGKAWGLLLVGGALVCFGLGGLTPPVEFGSGREQFTLADVDFWIAVSALVLLAVKCIVLFSTGQWWPPVAMAVAAVMLVGLGDWAAQPLARGFVTAGRTILSLEVVQPYWLLLLLLIPLIVKLSYRSLAGLGPTRRWLAIGLRSLLILLLTLALAEIRLRRPNETTTVYFVVDRSVSIPQDLDPADELKKDQRWQRIRQFIASAVEKRGTGHERDQAGVIVFGRRPRLVLPASDVPKMNLEDDAAATIDPTYTDISAAIKLALASFPEGTAKRIVLMSDGNENLGNAVEQARIAKENGVQIDTVTLAAGYKNENEVLVERVEAPSLTEQGARLPIRVLIRSYNPRMVTGTLSLRQLSEGAVAPVAIEAGPGVKERGPPAVVQLKPGLNAFSFRQTLEGVQKSYTYEAIFQPLESVSERGEVVRGLAGDRVQNNSATTHVVALGRRRVLLVEASDRPNEHRHLIDALQGMGDTKFQIATITAAELPRSKADLGVFLSNYDCVVLANVPAEEISEDQQEMIRSNTYDQGCGLVMIGGRDSFGAGGYQGTPVEKALPVDCDIKSIKVAGKGGLVLVMHASEADNGNALQKQIAKLAIQKLAPVDMVGMVYHDFTTKWHIKFQQIGGNKGSLSRQVDRMQPGDMPNFDPALQLAYDELSNEKHNLATKHCIIISDGDPQLTDQQLLQKMKKEQITVTTVGVATHGPAQNSNMQQIATATGGRAYLNPNPKAIPAIYIQETRIVSQSFLYENRFQPQLQVADGPASRLPGGLPPLYGFVRTSLKQNPLVTMAIEGPQTLDQRFPVLAYWQYGLGKAVAFTSDAKTAGGKLGWDREWAGSDMYLKFWEQILGWSLRGVETGKLALSSEYRDGKVRVTVDARDEKNKPMTDLRLQGLVTAPNATTENKSIELKFEQKNSGQYEAEFKAEEAGSYFINALAKHNVTTIKDGKEVVTEESDSVRSGVTLPYSPEFADLESNTALLRRLSEITGGNVYSEDGLELAKLARDGTVFRPTNIAANSPQPIWYWLVLLAGVGLLFDVAVRRIAIEPAEVKTALTATWEKLRGRAVVASGAPQFLERLQTRKVQVGEKFGKATKRFEAEPVPAGATTHVPVADDVARVVRPVAPPPPKVKLTADQPDTFARLMQAKRKALEERDAAKDESE